MTEDISKPLFIETLPTLDEATANKNDIKFAIYNDEAKPNQLLFTDIQNGLIGSVSLLKASLSNNPYAFKEKVVNGSTILYYGEDIEWNNNLPNYHGTSEGRITIVTLLSSLSLKWLIPSGDPLGQTARLLISSSLNGSTRPYENSPYVIPPFTEFTLEYTNNFTTINVRNELLYFAVLK